MSDHIRAVRHPTIDVTDCGARCDATFDPFTLALAGTDDTAAWLAAIAALPPSGGIIETSGLSIISNTLTLPPYCTIRGTGRFFHATHMPPQCGLIFLPEAVGQVAIDVPPKSQACRLIDFGVMTGSDVLAAVRLTRGGSLWLEGVKLHAIQGAQPGGAPAPENGTGLLMEQLTAFVRIGHCSIGGYSVGIEAEATNQFSVYETQIIGNDLGLRLGRVGGTTCFIYGNCCFSDNWTGDVDVIHTACCSIRDTNSEYGSPRNSFFLRVGYGLDDDAPPPQNVSVRESYLTGNANPSATAIQVYRADGCWVERVTFNSAAGTLFATPKGKRSMLVERDNRLWESTGKLYGELVETQAAGR